MKNEKLKKLIQNLYDRLENIANLTNSIDDKFNVLDDKVEYLAFLINKISDAKESKKYDTRLDMPKSID